MRRLLDKLAAGREVRGAAADWRRRSSELKLAFADAARASGKPKGLRWVGCDWTGPVLLARERDDGALIALVGIVVRFEAVPGGEMEEVEAVPLPRDATAVFRYKGAWQPTGQTLFNLTPHEATERLGGQIEPIETETERLSV